MFFLQFSVVFFILFNVCFFQVRIDGVVAIVGKNILLHSDVLQQAQFVALEQRVDPLKSPYLFEEIYFNARDNMINQFAILDVAEKDTTIVLSNDEVDRALDQQINDFILRAGSEKEFLDLAGMTMRQIKADYWKDIHDIMVVEKYQFSKIQNINVSRKEVDNFYNVYKDSIPSQPELFDFSVIELPFIASEHSEKEVYDFLVSLKNDIENNAVSFDSLAQIYSQDPGSAPSGGFLGYTSRGSLVNEYEEAAYTLLAGDISIPIKTIFGYHLIRLIDRQGEKISTQHILRTINYSKKDKETAYSLINEISAKVEIDPVIFDSLAAVFSKKYKNFSGNYQNHSSEEISDIIALSLRSLVLFEISSPIETEAGYALVYYYNHKNEMVPDLLNSWNLIYNYTKQKKQNDFFQSLIDKSKRNIYIKIINE